MHYSDFSNALLLHPGIVRIEPLSDSLISVIREMEYEHSNEGVMLSVPVGLNEVAEKQLKLILFCSINFRMFTEPFMEIIDDRGTTIGHDVLMGTQEKYDCED